MMISFLHIISPLDQFEIRNLISINAPILGNLSLSLTNIGLYLTLGGYLVFVLSLIGNNNEKLVSNS
jgi:F-type H+-transporting ATPase subunit a